MYSKTQLAFKYLQYQLQASNGKGHGIHSPFVFDFVTRVLNDRRPYPAYAPVESLRRSLLSDNRLLSVQDFGAGSRVNSHSERSVASIAASALKPKKFGQLFHRMARYYRPATMLELGTSLGLSTAYFASGNPAGRVITMEGAPAVAALARENFNRLQLQNISLVEGNFDHTLQPLLDTVPTIDLAYLDGNHRYAPTILYFDRLLPRLHEHSVVIVDDIHWSAEMERAWTELSAHSAVTLTIDLFFIGLLFFRKESLVKQHFTIRF